MAQLGSTEALTDEHCFRCFPPPGTAPDGVAAAVAAHIGPAAIRVIQKENRGYVVVTVSGAPPYLTNAKLRADLQHYGVVVSPIVLLLMRRWNREMRHILSGQRQAFLVLESGRTELDQEQWQQQQQQGGADSVPECGESAPDTETDDGGGFTVVRSAKKKKTDRRKSAQPEKAAAADSTAESASCAVETGGGGEAMEASSDAHLAEATEGARPPDPASPTPTQEGEEPQSAAGATGVPRGAAAPGSTPSPAPMGGEEETEEPEGSGLPGSGTEPSETLAPEGSAEVAGGAGADVTIGLEGSDDDLDTEDYALEASDGDEGEEGVDEQGGPCQAKGRRSPD
ncbi:unnamed protein product [Lampetra planeri]